MIYWLTLYRRLRVAAVFGVLLVSPRGILRRFAEGCGAGAEVTWNPVTVFVLSGYLYRRMQPVDGFVFR